MAEDTSEKSGDASIHTGWTCPWKESDEQHAALVVYEQMECMMRSAWEAFRTKQDIQSIRYHS